MLSEGCIREVSGYPQVRPCLPQGAVMANRPAVVTKIEVTRSISAAIAAGLKIGRIEVDHRQDKVVIFPEGEEEVVARNPCDRLKYAAVRTRPTPMPARTSSRTASTGASSGVISGPTFPVPMVHPNSSPPMRPRWNGCGCRNLGQAAGRLADRTVPRKLALHILLRNPKSHPSLSVRLDQSAGG